MGDWPKLLNGPDSTEPGAELKKKLTGTCVETFLVDNCISNKSNDLIINRNQESSCIYDINTLSECPELHRYESDMEPNYKQDFQNNMFNFDKCDSQNETGLIKHMYFYSQYLNHLPKPEFQSLSNSILGSLNLSCRQKDTLWKIYYNTQDYIDGKDNIDQVFQNL